MSMNWTDEKQLHDIKYNLAAAMNRNIDEVDSIINVVMNDMDELADNMFDDGGEPILDDQGEILLERKKGKICERGHPFRFVAYQDGSGPTTELYLVVEDWEGDHIADLPWPKHWPSWVGEEFLKSQGFELERE